MALSQERERESALVTFLVTASGVALFGIGSAFWGLLAGTLSLLILRATPDGVLGSRLPFRRARAQKRSTT